MQESVRRELEGRKVLVVGLGLQGGGAGLVKFLADHGARVTVTDKKTKEELAPSIAELSSYDITYTLGEHKLEDFLSADMIFKGPSVPWNMPELVEAEKRGIPIEMETSFFVAHCPAKIIGVTGTRGKSTTTNLIYEVANLGKNTFLGGNIPNKPAISLLDTVQSSDIVVLELSSWQLSGFHRRKVSPHIAVFTNIYPDHLNYYDSMESYLHDKQAIYQYQNSADYLVAHEALKATIEATPPPSTVHYFNDTTYQGELPNLPGKHNRENAAAALLVSDLLGFDRKDSMPVISSFGGLPFRQQKVREIEGVTFVNDTTSTTPVATIKALETFTDKPVVLIMGGNSKGLPTDELMTALHSIEHIVLLKGSLTDELMESLGNINGGNVSKVHDNFEEAIKEAYDKAKTHQTAYVLLSPGATSFAMFKNEFDRGEAFNRIVGTL
jgi:UDP-N-acetylmuramoylalanine--D-glutamate ligase